MITQTSPTAARKRGEIRRVFGRRGLATALAGLVIAIVVAGGIVLWRTERSDESAAGGTQVVQPAIEQPANPAAQPTERPVLYIVDSEKAAALAPMFAEMDAIRASSGLPPSEYDMLVVTSDTMAEQVLASTSEQNSIRVAMGLPEVEIIDLRQP